MSFTVKEKLVVQAVKSRKEIRQVTSQRKLYSEGKSGYTGGEDILKSDRDILNLILKDFFFKFLNTSVILIAHVIDSNYIRITAAAPFKSGKNMLCFNYSSF